MPCRVDGPPTDNERFNALTAMLCANLKKAEQEGWLVNFDFDMQRWWLDHKATDAAREAREKTDKLRKIERLEQELAKAKEEI